MLLLANLTLTTQSQFANTPNTFALFGNPKSDKEPKKDCLFATNRVTDVDIDANFKPFKLPFSVVDQKAGTALNSARKESCNGLYQI